MKHNSSSNEAPVDNRILLIMVNKFIGVFAFAAVLVGLVAIYYWGYHPENYDTLILLSAGIICILFGVYEFVSFRIELISPAACKPWDRAIALMILIDLAIGVIVAIYYHTGQNNTMFYPLIVGFVGIFILYFLIEKRMAIKAGKPVEKY